jgi:hypothetical protein
MSTEVSAYIYIDKSQHDVQIIAAVCVLFDLFKDYENASNSLHNNEGWTQYMK